MDWQDNRLSKRLRFDAEQTEALYATLSEIDAIKNAFRLTDKLLPQTLTRLTQSVIVTSAGASNRIEGTQAHFSSRLSIHTALKTEMPPIVPMMSAAGAAI
jgi:hypothetical protein